MGEDSGCFAFFAREKGLGDEGETVPEKPRKISRFIEAKK
jgi:hypothetical protein